MNEIRSLKDLPFFYILSMGRSGSTLLEFLLDAHPGVNIPIESRFIIHLLSKYKGKMNWTSNEKLEFVNDLFQDEKLSKYWNLDQKMLQTAIANSPSDLTFFEMCRIVTAHYPSFFEKNEILIQGSKNPIYALWADVLHELNQSNKYIHLVRNPLGVIASHKKLGRQNLYYFAYRWNLMNRKIERLKSKVPDQFITIRYEALIQQPEKVLVQVCDFLNISYRPEQLQFHKKMAEIKARIDPKREKEKLAIFESHLNNLINPIDIKAGESWQNTLSEQEIRGVSYITKSLAQHYNYNIEQGKGRFQFRFISAKIKVWSKYIQTRLYYNRSMSLK
jgi:hypothetical protein